MADIDQRVPDHSAPIWRITKSLVILNDTQEIDSAAFGMNGVLTKVLVTVPVLTQTTCTITIVDADGNTLFDSGALTKEQTTVIRSIVAPTAGDLSLREPICGEVYVKARVDSGNEGADRTIGIVLLGE